MKLSNLVVVQAVLWQSLSPLVTGQTCTLEQAVNDPCNFQVDNECDAGTFCPTGSDCFDCDPSFRDQDPCFAFSGTDCGTCTGATDGQGNQCLWCPDYDLSFAVCHSPALADAMPQLCYVSPGFISECPASCATASYQDQTLCSLSFNKICDSQPSVFYGSTEIPGRCGAETDCADCDPCHAHDATDCETCTSNGCSWCSTDAICWSPNLETYADTVFENGANFLQGRTVGKFTCTEADYARTTDECTALAGDNPYSDPLYEANRWVFDPIGVQAAWAAGFTGDGIGIRINDNGVDVSHADFVGKFDVDSSCQVYDYDPDDTSSHGTICAAIAAASGNNGECSVGIAPDATISSCRVISANPSPEGAGGDQSFIYAAMENMDVSNNSWGPTPCLATQRRRSRRLEGTCPFSEQAFPCLDTSACADTDWTDPGSETEECELEIIEFCTNAFNFEENEAGCVEFLDLFSECNYILDQEEQEYIVQGVTEGRQGKGVVYVFAAGNDFGGGEDTNQYGNTHNTRLIINVGSVGADNVKSTFSARGTGMFVVAPGGDADFWTNHIVAYNGGGCEDAGYGTSFAAPVVSGVVALILQANGDLTYRDVQGIIATTSTKIQEDDDSWVTNAAGIAHSDDYGFGLINAGAAVQAALTWELYSSERMVIANSGSVNVQIPDFTPQDDPVTSTVTMNAPDDFEIESVYLLVKLTHSSRGDLDITLTSPSGTASLVHPYGRAENGSGDGFWKFTTWKHFGEGAAGDWTLSVEDKSNGDVAECRDDPDYFFIISQTDGDIVVDCALLDLNSFCPEADELGGVPMNGPNDPQLEGQNGGTPGSACCSCGGGIDPTLEPDVLIEWRVVAYGRSDEEIQNPPTSAPGGGSTPSPSGVSTPAVAMVLSFMMAASAALI